MEFHLTGFTILSIRRLKHCVPKTGLLALGLLLMSGACQAQAPLGDGLYLGVGAGVLDSAHGQDRQTGASIRLGYEFNQRVGAELGYLGFQDSDQDLDVELDAWSASLVLSFPLTTFDLYGKLGATNLDGGQGVQLGSSSGTGRSTRGFAALGAQMRVGLFDLYGEFTRVSTDQEDDIDVFSAGLKFSF